MGSRAAKAQREDWNDLGNLDPFWAVVSAPGTQHNRWDLDKFYATGRKDIAEALGAGEAWGLPKQRRAALDFGCGVGRLTAALAEQFDEAVGVDISPSMLKLAREHAPKAEYTQMDEPGFPFPDNHFDMVYSRIALQHIRSNAVIRRHIVEFGRVLAPGGLLVFQLPSALPWKRRIQITAHAYHVLRRAGFPAETIYQRLGVAPMFMRAVPRAQVESLLPRALRVDETPWVAGLTNAFYYATKD